MKVLKKIKSLLNRYEILLETPMRGNDFSFDCCCIINADAL